PLGLPQGDFVLPDAVPVLPLFITAGSGITPVMSMLRSHAAGGRLPHIVHVDYAPHPYDVIFGGELETLANDHPRYRLPPVFTRGIVRFARTGITAETNGRMNLLRVAEDVGLNPPHGCRMGICHSCDTRLVSGCVRDMRSGAIVNEPGQTIQICVNAAAGNVEL